ncbi:MAG: SH3 domain-containing protein [Desulfuromonadales bacterium]|nr:SH3 domain-containing protein [Desulfuromonadales bacterium]
MKKHPAFAFLIMLVCFATLSTSYVANSYAENLSVSFSGTEMRSAPNAMASKVVTKLRPYSPLTVVEKGSDYYKVKDYRGRSGWVHRSLLSNTQGVVVTGDSANVRQGPGTNHPVSFQLSKGMTAKLIEQQDKWLLIQTADLKQGWIAGFLVWGK